MADNDPRTTRAFKQPAETRDDSDEDPLVELARIVGEDSNFYGARSERAKAGQNDGVERRAFSADLESELLNELESSISPRNAAPSSAAPASRTMVRPVEVRPEAASQPAADQGDELMRSIEEQLGAFDRRNQSSRPAQAPAPSQPHWSSRSEQLRASQPEKRDRGVEQNVERNPPRGAPLQPLNRGPQRSVLRAAAAPDPGAIAAVGRAEPGFTRTDNARSRADAATIGTGAAPRRGSEERISVVPERQVPLRPDRAAQSPFAPAVASGWNEIDEPGETPGAARAGRDFRPADGAGGLRNTFDTNEDAGTEPADEAAVRSARIEAELARELDSDYSDPSLAQNWPEPSDGSGEDEPRVAAAGGYYEDPAAAAPRRRRSRKGLLALASLLLLAGLGGGVVAYLRSGEEVASVPPPVIAAEEGAVKIQPPPAQQQAAEDTVGEAVYDRVAGTTAPTQEQVVESAEEPEEISRIVLPPAEPAPLPTDTADTAAGLAPLQPTPEAEPNVGPRRVRTYMVRPDGTIVSSADAPGEAAPADPAAAAAPAEPAEETQIAALTEERPAEPVSVPTTTIDEGTEQASSDAVLAEAEQPPAEIPAAQDAGAAIADLAPTQSPDAPAVPTGAEAPPADAVPAQVASAPATSSATAAAAGHFVQVSSQRSMDQAQSSFAGMKQQFPSVLGTLSADIQEADLGAKGTYYRVRVGPYGTRGEAIGVCEELKAAGGSCIVTR